MKKVLSVFIIISFMVTGQTGGFPVYAQDYVLPAPGVMVPLSPAFDPPVLTGIKVHPDDPLRFDFILLNGPGPLSSRDQVRSVQSEAAKLVKYFLASLTIPEKDLWVNLSPYEKNRIVPEFFGQTEMGRDLLAEDYILKQVTASLIYPEGETGRKFWKRIYEEAAKKFGTTDIPVNTFNKVWIVPEKAVVYENAKAGTAYVVEARLKVMLQQDYLALEKNTVILSEAKDLKVPLDSSAVPQNDVNALGSQVVREIVIPELTREVNEGKNFAQLRQVYNSLILATWYKKKIRDSILEKVYADKKKVAGLGDKNSINAGAIYQRYLAAFKKGVYNYIKEEQDPISEKMEPRKYFSGGLNMDMAMMSFTSSPGKLPDAAMKVEVAIEPERTNMFFSSMIEGGSMKKDWSPKAVLRKAKNIILLTAVLYVLAAVSTNSYYHWEIYSDNGKTYPFSENNNFPRTLTERFVSDSSDDSLRAYFDSPEYLEFSSKMELFLNGQLSQGQGAVLGKIKGYYSRGEYQELTAYIRDLKVAIMVHMQNKYHLMDARSYCHALLVLKDAKINQAHNAFTDTTGWNYLSKLNLKELIFVLAHENGHLTSKVNDNSTFWFDYFFLPFGHEEAPSYGVEEANGDFFAYAALTSFFPGGVGDFSHESIDIKMDRPQSPFGSLYERHRRARSFISDFRAEMDKRGIPVDWLKADSIVNQIRLPKGVYTDDSFAFFADQFLSSYLGVQKLHGGFKPDSAPGGSLYRGMIRQYFQEFDRSRSASGPEKGGIDLTPANMNLQIQNAGEGIKFRLDPAMLQELRNAPGFVPVIINIQALTDLKMFLGASNDQPVSP